MLVERFLSASAPPRGGQSKGAATAGRYSGTIYSDQGEPLRVSLTVSDPDEDGEMQFGQAGSRSGMGHKRQRTDGRNDRQSYRN